MPASFPGDLLERYRKVRALAERGGTGGEKVAARNVLDGMERDHPGIGAAVDASDAEPRVRRRESPPPPAPSWGVRHVPDPLPRPRPGFVPGYNPYAPPPGYGAGGHAPDAPVYVDPDGFNGRPWESRTRTVRHASGRSRWDDRHSTADIFDDFGMLPEGYGDTPETWRKR